MKRLEKALLLGALLLAAPGCTTDGFCFANCTPVNIHEGEGGPINPNDSGGPVFKDAGCQGFGCIHQEGSAPPTCTKTGDEVCDGIDNDCDGLVDEPGVPPDGIDFTDPIHCGNCDTDCRNLTVQTAVCVPPAQSDMGKVAGTCDYQGCKANQYDVDGDHSNGCEYSCPFNPGGVNTTDIGQCGIDDDCDGQIDEDLDTCHDANNCGVCGNKCTFPHAVDVQCVSTLGATGKNCDTTQAQCAATKCEAGWVNHPVFGPCGYQCTPTNGGVEKCDGVDNDCDGEIDNADSAMETGDPDLGKQCFGGTDGLCADPSHAGIWKCIGASLSCCDVDSNNVAGTNPNFPPNGIRNAICKGTVAPFVLHPNDNQEICNNVDDDCNGIVDDDTIDSGTPCGKSVGTCRPGTMQCLAGGISTCVGETPPMVDANNTPIDPCDGLDNDCDGVIDGTKPATKVACTTDAGCAGQSPNLLCLPLSSDPNDKGCVRPPSDVGDPTTGTPVACDVPVPPPAGVPTVCKAGTGACFGGVFVCQGSIKAAAGAVDRCNEDTNCDGQLTDQTGPSKNDIKNCGSCGNDCTALGPNASWSCVNGVCTRNGCQPGFIECGGTNPDDCETACVFQSSTESCNNLDDNCNCAVDEQPPPIVPPSPVQACGVNASATDPGCSSKVALSCNNGGWKCTFTDPAYCSAGTCPTTPDICDGKDNNCDGQIDEPFKPPALLVGFLGQACFSDDGKPAPGDGPCRTQGTFICKSDGTDTVCSATKDTSKATAELCDGIDNNCNGLVDDGLSADTRIGKQCFGGTQGICKDASHAGTTGCQNGGVVCTGANLVHPGDKLEVCNGLDDDCDGVVDNNLTDVGGVCGSGVGQCKTGTTQCVSGKASCVGATGPQPEVCDGLDNDCNGQIDDSPTDVGTACNVTPPPPAGVTQPCKAGVYACVGATRVCQGSIPPTQATDNCNEDTNCDGKLTDQTGLKNSDILNCGSCGHNCNTLDPNSVWGCTAGVCVRTGCKSGFIDCDSNPNNCETACTFRSSTESCNGLDDDCNCKVDDNVPAATTVQACGVSPAATDAGCTTGVTLACVSGAWKCTFPAGYCTGGNCSTMVDSCDGKDNNCSGVADENFKAPILSSGYLGQSCTSDQGKSPGDGPCQTTGSYVCNGTGTGTQCTAVKDNSKAKPETCNGIDDDCNGLVDDNVTAANDNRVGQQCFGGTQGLCKDPSHAGTTTCVGGSVVCQGANLLKPGQQPEICNGIDDDCNGVIDNNPTDVGGSCGSGVGACQTGISACVNGGKVCQGDVKAKPETCNGIDDDCDGITDNKLTDTGGDCNVPPAAPAPTAQCPVVTEPCTKGTLACSAGVLVCQGSTLAQSATDGCCVDSNCDGTLTNQPDFQTDVKNCGSCGNDCTTKGGHVLWGCSAGACVKTGCAFGFIDCDTNANDCERACTPSGAELCNNADDDCNCKVDDGVTVPGPSQVCGVSPAAQAVDSKCGPGDGTTGVKVACVSGGWQCTFPTGYCNVGTPAQCSTTPDNCDNKDNNCNGVLDDNYNKPILTQGYVGQPCASDDGKPPPGDGVCRTTGTFQCNGTTATKCNATKDLTKAGPELCDGADNDCDGSVDETFNAKGTNATYFVKPAVVKVGSFWMYEFEASRPNATTVSPGSGDGYYCTGAGCTGGVPAAPAGVTLDKTPACSVSGKIPWFNVTPVEVEQTCQAMGGTICSTPNWTTGCQAGSSCKWGYYSNCSASPATLTAGDGTVYYDTSKTPFCNLGLFDFDGTAGAPNADGLLVAKSGSLKGCLANYGTDSGGNPFGLFDITGNLREITKRAANDYPLMGGAFNTQSDGGAQCDFSFYSVPTSFKLFDAGFRCCFAADPTL